MAKAETQQAELKAENTKPQTTTPRKIPGNMPYLTASGTLKRTLERLIDAQRPDKFNADFLENILKVKGGAARSTIPILKRMNFLTSDSVPTEYYAKFKTSSGRGHAALNGLRSAYAEIFKRSEYAHAVDESKLKDLIVEVTGLPSSDPVAIAIKGTFNAIKSFIPANIDIAASTEEPSEDEPSLQPTLPNAAPYANHETHGNGPIRLSYNINIVLPETSDISVLNAIFRSVRENLMK